MSVSELFLELSCSEVAVTVAVTAAVTLGGALYVTPKLDAPVSEPGPLRLQLTPLFDPSLVSFAVMTIVLPWSVWVVGAERLTEMGVELQPAVKIDARNAEKYKVDDTNLLIKPPAKLLFGTAG